MYQGASFGERATAVALLASIIGGGVVYAKQAGIDVGLFQRAYVEVKPATKAIESADVAAQSNLGAKHSSSPPANQASPQSTDEAAENSMNNSAEDPSWDHQPIDKYLTFITPYSERVIRNFRLTCPRSEKTIRLIDSMRGAMSQMRMFPGAHLYMTVDSRDDEVRVYNQMRLDDGRSNPPHVVMSIDQWGELHTYGIIPSSIYFACYQ